MPEMTRYDDGVPSWVDMGTPDLPASIAFYSQLLGWEAQDLGEEAGHYNIMSKGGQMVAAITPAQVPGPPRWTTYVNVDDVDAVAKNAGAAGGDVVMAPTDVMSAGRMALFKDTTGAYIAAWQAGDHLGAQLVNKPGGFTWSELATSDLGKSKAFYSHVFGWGWGGSDQYVEAQVQGRTIGAMTNRRPEMPAAVPDFWLVYFGSLAAELDADCQKTLDLGGGILVPATDVPGTGRFAVLTDPQGATFALFAG